MNNLEFVILHTPIVKRCVLREHTHLRSFCFSPIRDSSIHRDDILYPFLMKCFCFDSISLKFVFIVPIDNNSALILITICHQVITRTNFDPVHRRTLQWRHNECNCVRNHWHLDCLLSRLFKRTSNDISKLRVTGLCENTQSVIGGFPSPDI